MKAATKGTRLDFHLSSERYWYSPDDTEAQDLCSVPAGK